MNINRITLANCHRIIALLELDDLTYTHLSMRDGDQFLLSPFGLLFEEVTPDFLLEIDFQAKVKTDAPYNLTGVLTHAALYRARKDVNSAIHLHTAASIAVSCYKDGLLPISQHAYHFYDCISYHDYSSLILDEESQAEKIARDLGENNVIFLRNHGFITCGKTMHEALFYAYHLQKACLVQVNCHSMDSLIFPDHSICEKARKDLLSFEKDLGKRDWDALLRKLHPGDGIAGARAS